MILRTHVLAKHFPIRDFLGRVEGQVRALDGVTLTLPEGKTLGIVGESGGGPPSGRSRRNAGDVGAHGGA